MTTSQPLAESPATLQAFCGERGVVEGVPKQSYQWRGIVSELQGCWLSRQSPSLSALLRGGVFRV